LQQKSDEGVQKILLTKTPEDGFLYEKYFRINKNWFNFLLEKLQQDLSGTDTRLRPSIKAVDKLAVTLRFLATGNSYSRIAL
jgi:hypothetical protein